MVWDAATWAQVTLAFVGVVVAVATALVAWFTYRFTIDSQPLDIEFVRSDRPSPQGTIPMHLRCRSPRAHLHQVWSPDWEGGDEESAPEVRMFFGSGEGRADCPDVSIVQGDVRMFNVLVPEGVTSFELVATASVDRRGRARNIWSDRIDVAPPRGHAPRGKKSLSLRRPR